MITIMAATVTRTATVTATSTDSTGLMGPRRVVAVPTFGVEWRLLSEPRRGNA